MTFFIGSALAAVAGVLVGLLNNLVEPTMGSVPSCKALAVVVLGGIGDVRGTLFAALFLGLIEAFGNHLSGIADGQGRDRLRRAAGRSHGQARRPSASIGACPMTAYLFSIITLVGINVILALGLNLITRFCGQGSVWGTRPSMASAPAQRLLPPRPAFRSGRHCQRRWSRRELAGLLVGLCSLRVREDFLAIATMAAGFIFIGVVKENDALGGEVGLSGVPAPLGKEGFIALVVVLTLLVIAFCLHVRRSWLGFSFAAVADDDQAAQLIENRQSFVQAGGLLYGNGPGRIGRRAARLLSARREPRGLRVRDIDLGAVDGGSRRDEFGQRLCCRGLAPDRHARAAPFRRQLQTPDLRASAVCRYAFRAGLA